MKGIAILGATGGLGEAIANRLAKRNPVSIGFAHNRDKAVITDCMNKTPLGRMGQPHEVAALVDFLISTDAAYISGQIIAVDGGYSA